MGILRLDSDFCFAPDAYASISIYYAINWALTKSDIVINLLRNSVWFCARAEPVGAKNRLCSSSHLPLITCRLSVCPCPASEHHHQAPAVCHQGHSCQFPPEVEASHLLPSRQEEKRLRYNPTRTEGRKQRRGAECVVVLPPQ